MQSVGESSNLAIPGFPSQNEGMVIEVSVEELRADLKKFLRLAQEGQEVLIKDGDNPVARLVEPDRDLFRTIPAEKPISELRDVKGCRPANLKPGDVEEAIRWAKSDWIDRQNDD